MLTKLSVQIDGFEGVLGQPASPPAAATLRVDVSGDGKSTQLVCSTQAAFVVPTADLIALARMLEALGSR
jgi:hypothetical protein